MERAGPLAVWGVVMTGSLPALLRSVTWKLTVTSRPHDTESTQIDVTTEEVGNQGGVAVLTGGAVSEKAMYCVSPAAVPDTRGMQ